MDFSDTEKLIRAEFLSESEELLEKIETSISEMSVESETFAEDLDELFRLVHTLKGSAMVAGFNAYAQPTHLVEELINQIRRDHSCFEQETIEVLLEANDRLCEFRDGLIDDIEFVPDLSSLEKKITRLLEEETVLHTGESDSGIQLFDEVQPHSDKEKLKDSSGTILIVDDSLAILQVFTKMVESYGFDVIGFSDPVEALKEIQEKSLAFDVLMSDLEMPGMRGFEFAENILKTHKQVPIIFCSGKASRKDVVRFLNMGAYAFIDKPPNDNVLASTLKNAVRDKVLKDNLTKILIQTHSALKNASNIIFDYDSDIPEVRLSQTRLKQDMNEICQVVGHTMQLTRR